MSDRARSASPRPDADSRPKPKKQKTTGFKWKEKKATEDSITSQQGSGGLERGYRNRSPRRTTDLRDNHDQSRYSSNNRQSRRNDDDRNQRPPSTSRRRMETDETNKASDSNSTTGPLPSRREDAWSTAISAVEKKSSKPKFKQSSSSSSATASNSPMIIVNVNDRLGTKAAIPCLASDSVKMFKAVVAAHIGRQPHEIMLKRQGERPFKDVLSLEDYGVSNGVQLDLEIDTGD